MTSYVNKLDNFDQDYSSIHWPSVPIPEASSDELMGRYYWLWLGCPWAFFSGHLQEVAACFYSSNFFHEKKFNFSQKYLSFNKNYVGLILSKLNVMKCVFKKYELLIIFCKYFVFHLIISVGFYFFKLQKKTSSVYQL